jgi:MinD-like ATPase involved in chromosome partitioning or flagellar assembly
VRITLLTAVVEPTWEAPLVAAVERHGLGLAVVRRCVDLADLLAAAGAGYARAALVSADLPRLDRTAVERLRGLGLVVIGLVTPGDLPSAERLARLGVGAVLPGDAAPKEVAALIRSAVDADEAAKANARASASARDAAPGTTGLGAPGSLTRPVPKPPDPDYPTTPPARGTIVAVWGPTGAPGRTTLALNLASELAVLGHRPVLVDADPYGGTVSQRLGLLEDAPGLAAAARAANLGRLDLAQLAGCMREVEVAGRGVLRVLTGILRPQRWPELSAAALGAVLGALPELAAVTVVDCGFCLEGDEELAFDLPAPRRNAATLAALSAADRVLAVGTGDPVGLARLLRGLGDLKEGFPAARPEVVVNRVRAGVIPGDAAAEIRAVLERYGGIVPMALLPEDGAAADAALARGRVLVEVAPRSPLRLGVATVAGALAPPDAPAAPGSPQRWRPRRRGGQHAPDRVS